MGDKFPKYSEAEAHLQDGSLPWPLLHEMICLQVSAPPDLKASQGQAQASFNLCVLGIWLGHRRLRGR